MRTPRLRPSLAPLLALTAMAFGAVVSCATTTHGTMGTGTAVAPMEMGVAGLTRSQQDRLARGPGAVSPGVLAHLIPRGTEEYFRLDLGPLRSAGLAAALLEHVPQDQRAVWDRLASGAGVDLVRDLDAAALWATDGTLQSGGVVNMALVAPRVPVRKMLDFFEVLGDELDGEGGDGAAEDEDRPFRILISGPVAQGQMDDVVALLADGLQEVRTEDLGPQARLLVGREDDRPAWAYVWRNGVVLGIGGANDTLSVEAAAARALAGAQRLEQAIADSMGASPTSVAFRGTLNDAHHSLDATVGSEVGVSYLGPPSVFGGEERVRVVLERFEDVRPMMKTMIERSPELSEKESLQAVALQALDTAEISEEVDGIRLEFQVDADALAAALLEMKPGG